ncbi:MAG: extracellular solute-binding protein [Geminocystis sp.]|nr:extracellular solute-binding protein [Geminocystis sp.]MCS7147360.1 extracellular solute-binding protein [Geminocystis sp.]MCX8079058.1 extracellular solute-binding protein [Geminocystis sp.]MDW8116359.1 extracellular solute-binding protein [Geminocystis sp.]MDW8462651.1 extracellular solute-binding protein [Geminocystis sp.]
MATTTEAISLISLLSACDSENVSELNIAFLAKSLPPQLLASLKKNPSLKTVKLKPEASLEVLYQLLVAREDKDNKSPSPHLVSLGDYWLTLAIDKNLIHSLALSSLPQWQQIPPKFQQLVTRDNKIWGAPYRWGCTMIAYRQDLFQSLGWQPSHWQDLWHEDLKGRISLPNHPREVIGLVLKKLGYSYNTPNPQSIPSLIEQLQTLHQQVKFYDSRNYLQPLILGDTWLAVGWSSDIVPVVQRYHKIKAVIPSPGTSLWADVWVLPSIANLTPAQKEMIYQWVDFCWQPEASKQISLFTSGYSPLLTHIPPDVVIPPPTPAILDNSEFISPSLSPAYRQIWQSLFY